MRFLSKRVRELETLMNPEPSARIYDYRRESDTAWFRFCEDVGLAMYDLLRRIDGEPTQKFDEMVEKTVAELMQQPKEQRFN